MAAEPADPRLSLSPPTPQVVSDLHPLGVTCDSLREAALAGQDEAGLVTANDVVTRAGYVRWATPLRYLGDIYVPQGWSREHPKGFELLISPDRTIGIGVAPGDSATGTDRMPSTRVERGPLTGQAVAGNQHQIRFATEVHPQFADKPMPGMQTWLLLHFFDEQAEELRIELSVPVEFTRTPKSERGFVTKFDPRIILPAVPLVQDTSIGRDDDDDDDQIEVPVGRRL